MNHLKKRLKDKMVSVRVESEILVFLKKRNISISKLIRQALLDAVMRMKEPKV